MLQAETESDRINVLVWQDNALPSVASVRGKRTDKHTDQSQCASCSDNARNKQSWLDVRIMGASWRTRKRLASVAQPPRKILAHDRTMYRVGRQSGP
ncbi:hypothetical protein L484_006302 [Morus notabilis]|uniref:Uncharacterized protein n=1 Tax=Morus notabilis TaxID=981085 RepID=W9QT48_9ROSA|nr:hypothetical protein L484_006302 [Morus notabilis]